MTPMPSISLNLRLAALPLRLDLLVVAFLVGLDIVARLVPHAPDFTPVAASGLFAASALRVRSLSLVVPLAGIMLGDAVLGFYDWRVSAVAYGALTLPACTAYLSSRLGWPRLTLPILLGSSLTFFLLTNFAVWVFSPLYAADLGGLVKCYLAGLPFLKNMLAGDLSWGFILFGSCWFLHRMRPSGAAAFA